MCGKNEIWCEIWGSPSGTDEDAHLVGYDAVSTSAFLLQVSVVTRDEVGAYKPYLWEQSVFEKGPMFREWVLTKIVNGERASYSAPKFARMQERTRSQMLEDIVANLANHAETGQIPKPYRWVHYLLYVFNKSLIILTLPSLLAVCVYKEASDFLFTPIFYHIVF